MTFEQALSGTGRIAGVDGDFLLAHARLIAAAVAPDLLPDIPAPDHLPRYVVSELVGKIMLDHQHLDFALDYLLRYGEPSTFPFGVAAALMRSLDSNQNRLAVLRSSITAWRTARKEHHFHQVQFISIFQSQWKLLPVEEAVGVVREIVRLALDEPDHPVTAKYDPEGTAPITSGRAHALFQIFHIIRQLDAMLAESLIADHDQLEAALRRFPNGMESVREESDARRAEARRTGTGAGYGIAGSTADFPYMKALIQASQYGDFGSAMQHATEKYREDAAPERPNHAPKEFWPSANRFRGILYKAGKQPGNSAAVYLEWIPDADLRLFARLNSRQRSWNCRNCRESSVNIVRQTRSGSSFSRVRPAASGTAIEPCPCGSEHQQNFQR